MSELKPTPAKQWRKGKLITLPSGNTALLRKPDPAQLLARAGEAPDLLSAKIAGMVNGQEQSTEIQLTPDNLHLIMATLDKLCKAAFVEPRVVDKPQGDEIGPDDIELGDKLEVFKWCFGGSGDAALIFPGQPPAGVGDVSDRKGVRPAPVSPGGNTGAVDSLAIR